MTQFNLKGKDVPHIADLLAAGADKALGSVTDLGYGLSQVGTTADQMGFSIEDTVGTLAEFAQSGLTGERGRHDSQADVPPARVAHEARPGADGASTGSRSTTPTGRSRRCPSWPTTCSGRSRASTRRQRNAALGVIFGSRAIQGANILIKDGEKKNRAWIKSVDDQGFAAHQASGKMDSLKGDLKKLDAELENAFIGQGGKQGLLRGMVQDATKLVKKYNELSDAQKKLVGKGFVGAAAVGGALWTANKIYEAAKGTAGSTAGLLADQRRRRTGGCGWRAGSRARSGTSSKAARGGLLAIEVAMGFLAEQAQDAIGQIGSRGKENGILNAFDKPRSTKASAHRLVAPATRSSTTPTRP
jgi:hypothetical protein